MSSSTNSEMTATLRVVFCALAVMLCACDRHEPTPDAPSQPASARPVEVVAPPAYTDAQRARGAALARKMECARCHTAGERLPDVAQQKNCVGCHQAILRGDFRAPEELLAKWSSHITNLVDAPTPTHLDRRMRAEWFVAFLRDPHDLRPHLGAMMPRMRVTQEDAWSLAAHFDLPRTSGGAKAFGDIARGEQLVSQKGCLGCHGDAAQRGAVDASEVGVQDADLGRAVRMAPAFHAVKGRMPHKVLVQWIQDPQTIKPDAVMPNLGITASQARDIAAYLTSDEVVSPSSEQVPTRLAPLERGVPFEEVHAEVFDRVCWHCHSDPAYNNGDGGPGNTGGFGFAGAGLDLSSEQGALWGVSKESGEEYSILEPVDEAGTPRIVEHLMARHREVRGRSEEMLGMPLGHPPLSLKQIQLVETWARQARAARDALPE